MGGERKVFETWAKKLQGNFDHIQGAFRVIVKRYNQLSDKVSGIREDVETHTHAIDTLEDTNVGTTVGDVLTWDGDYWAPDTPTPVISDHGGLAGLADDDHPQYLTQAEGDGLYDPLGGTALIFGIASDDTNTIPNATLTFPLNLAADIDADALWNVAGDKFIIGPGLWLVEVKGFWFEDTGSGNERLLRANVVLTVGAVMYPLSSGIGDDKPPSPGTESSSSGVVYIGTACSADVYASAYQDSGGNLDVSAYLSVTRVVEVA